VKGFVDGGTLVFDFNPSGIARIKKGSASEMESFPSAQIGTQHFKKRNQMYNCEER
jgi:hypothetical protein